MYVLAGAVVRVSCVCGVTVGRGEAAGLVCARGGASAIDSLREHRPMWWLAVRVRVRVGVYRLYRLGPCRLRGRRGRTERIQWVAGIKKTYH